MSGEAFSLIYADQVKGHLRAIDRQFYSLIRRTIEAELRYQPDVETRNRKPMRPNPLAPWELRIGELRVYYEIEEDPGWVVTIVAVGVKDRNRVLIGGKEFEL